MKLIQCDIVSLHSGCIQVWVEDADDQIPPSGTSNLKDLEFDKLTSLAAAARIVSKGPTEFKLPSW